MRDSRLTFRTDRGFVGERRSTGSDSDEGRDGNGVFSSVRTRLERVVGRGAILIPRLAGVFLLRGRGADWSEVDCIMIRQEGWGKGSDDLRAF